MTEIPDERDARAPRHFSWSRALTAGAIATIVMTITLMLTGNNIMKMLGSMLLPNAGTAAQYAVGGAIHLMIGLFYGVVYAWLVGRVSEWNRFVKGAVYGLALTGIALAVMPVMTAMMGGGGGAANPCSGAAGAAATNPCDAGAPDSANASAVAPGAAANPCATKAAGAENPCAAANPCNAAHAQSAGNPCAAKNPCGDAPANPCAAHGGDAPSNACHAAAASNPCGGGAANPCSPSGGSQPPTSGVFSLVNHLVFGLTLAFAYGRGR